MITHPPLGVKSSKIVSKPRLNVPAPLWSNTRGKPMTPEQRAELIEAMIDAHSRHSVEDIGGLRNVDFAAESMQDALAVAEQVIRDDVLEEVAVYFDEFAKSCSPSNVGAAKVVAEIMRNLNYSVISKSC